MQKPGVLHSKRTESVSDAPQTWFNAEALGATFQQLAIDVVRGETTDFMSRWFRSSGLDADLVIWTDSEKRVLKHQLCFYGQVVEWSPLLGTRTGLVIEEEVVLPETGAEVSEMIRFDETTSKQVVSQAISVLTAISALSESDRSALIYNLRESPKLHPQARQRALKAWAPHVEALTSSARPKFWRRLKTWVLGD